MSKVRNLASTIKHLKGESFKRAAVMIRDYGWGEFFHKLGTRIKYGPGTAVVNNNMYGGELAGESFVKNPSEHKGYQAEERVSFTFTPSVPNIGRIELLTQNRAGGGALEITVSKGDAVLLHAEVGGVAHDDYTAIDFLPICGVMGAALTVSLTCKNGCGVYVNRNKRRHGFSVDGGGSVGCRIYTVHNAEYLHWIANNTPTEKELNYQRARVFNYMPKISIVVPLYNTPEKFLRQMIESVQAQTYSNWDLCLADGSTSSKNLGEIAHSYEDARILYRKLEENKGISGNSNEAIRMATGDYVALLDHDDLLMPHALYSYVELVNIDRDYEFMYSDEDKITEDGKYRFNPFFKPDFAPDTLHTFNYITHFSVFKKTLLDKIGGFEDRFNGAQDFDIILRATEKAKKIGHISDILYHWRISEGSTALASSAKSYTVEAGRSAVEAAYQRLGIKNAHVSSCQYPNYYITRYDLPDPKPLISIIIPNKDEKRTLENCITSITEKSTYPNYEIIIAENNSTEKEIFDYYAQLEQDSRIRIVRWDHPFNYSALNNYAASQAKGDLLLFLNNDISVISPDWLEQMAMHAMRPEIGQVGAKLYYPDNTIQHSGIVLKIGPVANHPHKFLSRFDIGYFGLLVAPHNVSSVTAACAMMRASVFREVGGFDETFTVAYNDVDLSLKVREKGYYILWTPFAELYHDESKTRGLETTPEKMERLDHETALWLSKWDKKYPYDPYYNINLTNEKLDYSVSPNKILKDRT